MVGHCRQADERRGNQTSVLNECGGGGVISVGWTVDRGPGATGSARRVYGSAGAGSVGEERPAISSVVTRADL
jgi:hypothetical protein